MASRTKLSVSDGVGDVPIETIPETGETSTARITRAMNVVARKDTDFFMGEAYCINS